MLSHFTRGEGARGVFLLHGFLGQGRNLASLAHRLAEARTDLRFIVPDLTGHGTSPSLPPAPTLAHLARDVFALAEHAGVTAPLTVVGHSMGGRTALEMAALDSSAVERVVLLDVAPGPMPARDDELFTASRVLFAAPARLGARGDFRAYFLERGVSAATTEWLLMNLVPDGDGVAWRFDRARLHALHDASNARDLWPAAERLGARLGVIRGGRSRFVTDADVQRLERLGVACETLADAGHFVHVDALPALVSRLAALI